MQKTQKVSAITLSVSYNATNLDSVLVTSANDAAEFCHKLIADKPRENFISLHLNAKNEVVAYETVTIGTVNSSQITVADIFKSALLTNATAIIICHNHPSGNSQPSAEDLKVTERVVEAGQLLGINVLDSLVIGRNEYSSIIHKVNRSVITMTIAAETAAAPAVEVKTRKPRAKKALANAVVSAIKSELVADAAPSADMTKEQRKAQMDELCRQELAKKSCTCCKPRQDVMTVKMWNSAGFRVKKGEKAMRVGQFSLFCRCQVSKMQG